MTLVAPGVAWMYPTVPTSPRRIGQAQLLDLDDAFGRARQRVAPQCHRHGAGVTGHAGEPRRQTGGAGNRADHADRQIFRLQHRALLDVQLDIGQQFAARPCGGADMIGVETELNQRLAHRDVRQRPWTPARVSLKVPATARLPSRVDANRTPSSSAKPVTSTANGKRFPRLLRSATQEIAVIRPSGPSHLPASRTVS